MDGRGGPEGTRGGNREPVMLMKGFFEGDQREENYTAPDGR